MNLKYCFMWMASYFERHKYFQIPAFLKYSKYFEVPASMKFA